MNARCRSVALTATSGDGLEGLDHSIQALTEMVRVYQRAEACLIVIDDPRSNKVRLYRAQPAPGTATGVRRTAEELIPCLLGLPGRPVVFNKPQLRASPAGASHPNGRRRSDGRAALDELANLLEVDSFICVPLPTSGRNAGRLCIASGKGRYMQGDLRLTAQIARQAATIIEAINFAERLAIELARQERRQISRDLHDSAIQPYIGLKLGLEALRRRLRSGHQFAHEVDELINIAGDGVGELRQYVGDLKTAAKSKKADSLLPAVRCQAKKFTAFYGIEATVVAPNDIPVTAPMQHEIIQIVREGLSNIRRHTTAERATIHLRERRGKLLVELINDNAHCTNREHDFFPRSIGERAKELGGRVKVEQRNGRHTVVAVELPL
jgi:signal transduction histidine kinase